jgi:glycosyltransferase involved in cell wall biosynthesis
MANGTSPSTARGATIVAYTANPDFGGTEKWLVLLLAGLQRRGHRVVLVCRFPFIADQARAYGVEARVYRLGGDIMLPHILGFARLLRRLDAGVLVVATFRKLPQASLAARLAGVGRIVARIGLSTDLPVRWKYLVTLRRFVHRVALNADHSRREFVEMVPGLDPSRVITLYDGVHLPERSAGEGAVRRALGLPLEARVIGTIARLAHQKRFDRLLHALAQLPQHVHCVLAGKGDQQAALEKLATELGVRSRLHLLGFREDIGDVLDAFDIFVISSDHEGMANAMLEAMALGVPTVSTPVSGAAEALDPLDDGEVPGEIVGFSADELAASLRRLLADDALRHRMGAAARRRWEERFSFEEMLGKWEALLTGGPAWVHHDGPSPLLLDGPDRGLPAAAPRVSVLHPHVRASGLPAAGGGERAGAELPELGAGGGG